MKSGTKLGPYQIAERIGAGGMGELYRATDTRLGRSVAFGDRLRDGDREEGVQRQEPGQPDRHNPEGRAPTQELSRRQT